MRFFLDENFPHSIACVIEDAGHEIVDFSSCCDFGATDENVTGPFENRVFVLRDFTYRVR